MSQFVISLNILWHWKLSQQDTKSLRRPGKCIFPSCYPEYFAKEIIINFLQAEEREVGSELWMSAFTIMTFFCYVFRTVTS